MESTHESAFKPHAPLLFGILTMCVHTHICWDSEGQIIQSNVHADRVQLIRVHLLGADNPVGTHGFSDWLKGGGGIIDCWIKELEKSAE